MAQCEDQPKGWKIWGVILGSLSLILTVVGFLFDLSFLYVLAPLGVFHGIVIALLPRPIRGRNEKKKRRKQWMGWTRIALWAFTVIVIATYFTIKFAHLVPKEVIK